MLNSLKSIFVKEDEKIEYTPRQYLALRTVIREFFRDENNPHYDSEFQTDIEKTLLQKMGLAEKNEIFLIA